MIGWFLGAEGGTGAKAMEAGGNGIVVVGFSTVNGVVMVGANAVGVGATNF